MKLQQNRIEETRSCRISFIKGELEFRIKNLERHLDSSLFVLD